MPFYDGDWPRTASVGDRRVQAAREVAKLRAERPDVEPVTIEGKTIAATFWGKAWCRNLERYHDFANRLSRGRSYVRSGSVLDLKIAPRRIDALVSGSSLYRVSIAIAAVPPERWQAICEDCTGAIDSLVELLQGRLSAAVMERLCRQETGLFPAPAEIEFACSCPDRASMCKHVAATLYGVGTRLDDRPELLFTLRAVDQNDLVASLGNATPGTKASPAPERRLHDTDLAELFGLDLSDFEPPSEIFATKRAEPIDVAKMERAKPQRAEVTKRKTPQEVAVTKRVKPTQVAGKERAKPTQTAEAKRESAEPAAKKNTKLQKASPPKRVTVPRARR